MTELATPRPPTAASDLATIVFIRPSGAAAGIVVTVLDEKGRFIGDALASSYFVRRVDPGEHTFISWAENTGALQANLDAGKVYFVEVELKFGVLSPRAHLKALTPRTERWSEREAWLSDSVELEVDERRGQDYLDARSADVEERVRRAKDALSKYSPVELADRTISPDDGI